VEESRPQLEVADVIRTHGQEFLETMGDSVSLAQERVLRDLAACRTAALGGHLEVCTECGHERPAYDSCRNRSCPKCQASNRREWYEAREGDLLPVEYFHVVFTVPQEIAKLALQNKREVYQILFRSSADTLKQIAADPKHLGAEVGFMSVLHTWGQTLTHHPHVHCVVPGGGLSPDGSRWISCPRGFFLPVKVLSPVFRGKFLQALREAFDQGRLSFGGGLAHLNDPTAFRSHLATTHKTEWVVYSKPPFGGPEQVLKYLARYTHRVAISNWRLVSLEDGKVSFTWKDYANGNRQRVMTLDAMEFIRRFLLHVLPKGFVRIRHYGFLANRVREANLQVCREFLGVETPSEFSWDLFGEVEPAEDSAKSKEQGPRCPVCRQGTMVPVCALFPEPAEKTQRSPPQLLVAA
jgi:hypothetical protein